MAKQLAFYLDTSACSGCKACQVACKDKNNLEVGVLWRRVYEVTGGEWIPRGAAWESTAFAYSLSVSCMHCEKPICKEVCPTAAITKRDDGVVVIDQELCIGCRYCAWACPYGAPQFNEALGKMTKCDFCVDYLDQGLQPACVSACPLRALDFGELEELRQRYGSVNHLYPLPDPSLTQPSVVFTPHKDARRASHAEPAMIGNREEV